MPPSKGFRKCRLPQIPVGCSSQILMGRSSSSSSCSLTLPIPIISLAKEAEKSPVYQSPLGREDDTGPIVLATHCATEVRAQEFVLSHIALNKGGLRKLYLSARIVWPADAEMVIPEWLKTTGWITIWSGQVTMARTEAGLWFEPTSMGESGQEQSPIGTLHCALVHAQLNNGHVCICGKCAEEWLAWGWWCPVFWIG